MEIQTLINALYAFAAKRPGFDFGDYGRDGIAYYRADVRKAGQQLNDARAMLRFCEMHNITPDLSAYSRRLSLENGKLDYTAGQYYCTEYRAAVCACCAKAIRAWWMTECGHKWDAIKSQAKRCFGLGVANRWFA